jgi:simple sugar transport system permease protein
MSDEKTAHLPSQCRRATSICCVVFGQTPELGPLILLIVMLVVFTSINPAFMSLNNISNALTFTVELGAHRPRHDVVDDQRRVRSVGGLGLRLHRSRDVDADQLDRTCRMPLSFLIAMAVAVSIGAVNGFFVTRLKIPSFLVTLGMLLVVRGSALWLTSGFPQRTWETGNQWLAEALVGDFCIVRAISARADCGST